MNHVNWSDLVTNTFLRLRQRGFNLGLHEYLAALEILKADVALQAVGLDLETTEFEAVGIIQIDAIKAALQLLWCSSRSERKQFEPIWDDVLATTAQPQLPQVADYDPTSGVGIPPSEPEHVSPHQPAVSSVAPEVLEQPPTPADLAMQPVRAPFSPAEVTDLTDLQTYWPLSRRSMSYTWRYLRRPVLTGAATVLDVAATVDTVARSGIYLSPVFRRRSHNQAHLVLFIDQNGSMMPFHRLTRDLLETASVGSSLPSEHVTPYYFHNSPSDYLYQDVFLTQPIAVATALADIDQDTSVLIVSDGGAARGYRRLDRIQATTQFLLKLRRVTTLIAWLNPMPTDRWEGSSADIIANLVPMFQMDDDGLSNAIDIVRGQPLQPLQSPWL